MNQNIFIIFPKQHSFAEKINSQNKWLSAGHKFVCKKIIVFVTLPAEQKKNLFNKVVLFSIVQSTKLNISRLLQKLLKLRSLLHQRKEKRDEY